MKRLGLLIIAIIGTFSLIQAENNDVHIKRLIECFNNKDFVCAKEKLGLVEDWTFNGHIEVNVLDSAIEYLNTIDSLWPNTSGLDSFKVYISRAYEQYIMACYGNSEFEKAIPYCKAYSLLIKLIYGECHANYATSINDIGVLCYMTGDFSQAEKCYLQAYKIYNDTHSAGEIEYLNCLTNLGVLYYNMENYGQAEYYMKESMEAWRRAFTEQHPGYAQAVNGLGALYCRQGNYTEAEKCYLQALEIREVTLSNDHPDIAQSYNNIGTLYLEKGDYEQAEQYCIKAKEIYEKNANEQYPDYTTVLHNLGFIYKNKGEYSKAEQYYLRVLDIRKKTVGEVHPDYAATLNDLGTIYEKFGNFAEAERLYLQSLQIKEKIFGKKSISYATVVSDLGILYETFGEYTKAKQYFLQAMSIYESIFGDKHVMYITVLENIGRLYLEMGNTEKAEQCYIQSLTLKKELFGEKHHECATTLNDLGYLYKINGEYVKAEKYLQQSLKIKKETLGDTHPTYITTLNNLGDLYLKIGDINKSESYFQEAIKRIADKMGTSHPDYARYVYNLGAMYFSIGEYWKSELYLPEAIKLYQSQFLQTIDYMSERQRAIYWGTMEFFFCKTLQLLTYRHCKNNPNIVRSVYGVELFYKGALLQSMESIKRSVQEGSDTTLIRQWRELTELKKTLIYLQQYSTTSPYIEKYEEMVETLEKEITRSSAAYREHQRQWTITWDSVRAELKPNQVAIEYMTAPLNEDSTMYCALLLRDTCSYPIMIPLFEEKEVTSLLHTSTGDTANINTTYMYGRHGSQLSNLIWSKVQPYLNQREVVFISPTGLLHQVAFENLPYDSTRTMTDVYNIVRLSSTRELAMHKDSIAHTAATLYGGIKYHVSTDVMYANNQRYRDIDREGIKDLPGTKQEVEAIAPILRDHNIEVHVFSADTANEESFKALSGKKQNILHIGTHGFYWTDSTAQSAAYFKQRTLSIGNDQYAPKTIDPLNRCGLLFAGASTAISGDAHRLQEGVQDGVLTAKEISLMDLRDADIVVLSACETGLGDVTGDGVFGLQRAFKMAGARTILMSLWKVDDDATRMLMTSFYRYYVNGMSKRAAFRKAQQEVRNYAGIETGDESVDRAASQDRFKNKGKLSSQTEPVQQMKEGTPKYPYQSPYHWAGFILLD